MATFADICRAEGLEQGMQQGIQQGAFEGQRQMLLRQLIRRFGVLSPACLRRIENANALTLLIWGENILDAKRIEEVFAD